MHFLYVSHNYKYIPIYNIIIIYDEFHHARITYIHSDTAVARG